MFLEEDFLPISALQHLAFCERQWALIHLERIWTENIFAIEGRHLHDKVHCEGEFETRGSCHIARSLRLRSLRLGLTGQADIVEFTTGENGNPIITPIEYKHGKPKIDSCDEVQLCAQALCLEEMLNVSISEGYFFYGKPRRRHKTVFSEKLRIETEKLISKLHELFKRGETPSGVYEKKCDTCSLYEMCMPKMTQGKKSALRYLNRIITDFVTNDEEGVGRI